MSPRGTLKRHTRFKIKPGNNSRLPGDWKTRKSYTRFDEARIARAQAKRARKRAHALSLKENSQ